ncbi:FxsA family protein (plasmid) [Paracoccus sp. TK19116]|uniref:FxsA family protein n=1 Tax=Paracoccus albicereus TaxID=2922394 RepID=A0ABT1MLN3_9RHOB|nr:FxsA family protein [Paracoccus albicereus]MCQ0969185.1 FxsA family protein [Paracoccus albicereus]
MRLVALFLIVPLIEIWLFITIGGQIGVWPTIGLVVLSAVVGATLVRAQGARAWTELQGSITEFRDPGRPLAHGAMILLAGAMLMTPGFFTDTLGLLLLVPPVRDWVIARAGRRVQMSRTPRDPHRPPFGDGVIDADFVELDPDETHDRYRHDAPRPDMLSDDEVVRRPTQGQSGWTRH